MNNLDINSAYVRMERFCRKKLEELYPAGVPIKVMNRYIMEIHYMIGSGRILDFDLYRELSKAAEELRMPLRINGTAAGSMLCFLLGDGRGNPMEAHYYCEKCGNYEFMGDGAFGVDLPKKTCPECRTKMRSDGYGIPLESVWSMKGILKNEMEYSCCPQFLKAARRILNKLYPRRKILTMGLAMSEQDQGLNANLDFMRGFVILPEGKKPDNYKDFLVKKDGKTYFVAFPSQMKKMHLETVYIHGDEFLDYVHVLAGALDMDAMRNEFRNLPRIRWRTACKWFSQDSRERYLFQTERPKSVKQMAQLLTFAHTSFVDGLGDPESLHQRMHSEAFLDCPLFDREDFLEALLHRGMDLEKSYQCFEGFRRGKLAEGIPEDMNLPDDVANVAKGIRGMFPRAFGVETILLFEKVYHMERVVKKENSDILDIH